MSGTLYVVATPIGNLEDISLRAIRVLREVSVIAAEDTRRTSKLLLHHAISTPALSFHEHNSHRRLPEFVRRLRADESVALVSDAGTPLISDPGLELVQACIADGVRVEPIPGPSAPLTALVASGFAPQPVTILGFAPSRSNERKRWLKRLSGVRHTVVFFEAPHRIMALLNDAAPILGDRPLCLARELTKVHQELLRGTAIYLAEHLREIRGEITVVLGPASDEPVSADQPLEPQHLVSEFRQLTERGGLNRRGAITELARRYGCSSREVYAMLESSKPRFLDRE